MQQRVVAATPISGRLVGRFRKALSSRRVRLGAAIFVIFAALYAWIQSGQSFLDPDSFYHAKMGWLTAQHGIVSPFPWLPFTTLADAFADHHYLYHLLLVPFIGALGPFAGTRTAAVLFAAAAITMFYAVLTIFKVKGPALYAILLGCAGGFALRLNLAKASSLSLCVLFAAVILIEKRRPLALFALSWLYVWLYGGWPLLLLVGPAILAGEWALERFSKDRASMPAGRIGTGGPMNDAGRSGAQEGDRSAHGVKGPSREVLRCALAIPAGLVCGLVVHPYFPQNLRFYWEQIVQIGVLGYGGRIEVGSEWYPYPPLRLLVELGPVFMTLFLVILVVLPLSSSLKRERAHGAGSSEADGTSTRRSSPAYSSIFAKGGRASRGPRVSGDAIRLAAPVLLAVLFLVMTLRSRRYVEYFAPFAMLATALVANERLRGVTVREIREKLRAGFGKLALVPVLIGLYLGGLFVLFMARDLLAVRAAYREGIPWSRLARASTWLTQNTRKDSVIVQSDFNEFPMLFYNDDRNRYILGLDPAFFYRKSPEKYRIWSEIVAGRTPSREESSLVAAGGESSSERALGSHRTAFQSPTPHGPDPPSVGEIIENVFDSGTVLISKEHAAMKSLVAADPSAVLAYEDDEVWIYELSSGAGRAR